MLASMIDSNESQVFMCKQFTRRQVELKTENFRSRCFMALRIRRRKIAQLKLNEIVSRKWEMRTLISSVFVAVSVPCSMRAVHDLCSLRPSKSCWSFFIAVYVLFSWLCFCLVWGSLTFPWWSNWRSRCVRKIISFGVRNKKRTDRL